jgi:hypothetical protein
LKFELRRIQNLKVAYCKCAAAATYLDEPETKNAYFVQPVLVQLGVKFYAHRKNQISIEKNPMRIGFTIETARC